MLHHSHDMDDKSRIVLYSRDLDTLTHISCLTVRLVLCLCFFLSSGSIVIFELTRVIPFSMNTSVSVGCIPFVSSNDIRYRLLTPNVGHGFPYSFKLVRFFQYIFCIYVFSDVPCSAQQVKTAC